MKKDKFIQGKASVLSGSTGRDCLEDNLEEENVRGIINDVLNELYYSKGKKEIQK